MKGGAGLAEGIEVFPRQDELGPDEFGNGIRGPLGVHRAVERRYWFYGADYTLDAQLDYLERLKKITEEEMATFVDGLEMPQEFRRRPTVVLPPYDPTRQEFRILDHVGPMRKCSRELLGALPVLRGAGTRSRRGQSGDFSLRPAQVQVLGRMHQRDDPRRIGTTNSSQEGGMKMKHVATTQSHPVDHRELLARQGLRLPAVTLKHLRSAGIYCQPSISIEHQHLAKKYVLRGVESGGAVGELGAYSSFVDEQGAALSWLQRIDSIGSQRRTRNRGCPSVSARTDAAD